MNTPTLILLLLTALEHLYIILKQGGLAIIGLAVSLLS